MKRNVPHHIHLTSLCNLCHCYKVRTRQGTHVLPHQYLWARGKLDALLTCSLSFIVAGMSVLNFPGEDREDEEGKGMQRCLSSTKRCLFFHSRNPESKVRQVTHPCAGDDYWCSPLPISCASVSFGQEQNSSRIGLRSALWKGTLIKSWKEAERDYRSPCNLIIYFFPSAKSLQLDPHWTHQTCHSN